MSIHKIGSDPVRPHPARDVAAPGRGAVGEGGGGKGRPARADRVAFSEEGLALADRAHCAAPELSAERLETLHRRVAEGFYDESAVAEQVARRILVSGDMDVPS